MEDVHFIGIMGLYVPGPGISESASTNLCNRNLAMINCCKKLFQTIINLGSLTERSWFNDISIAFASALRIFVKNTLYLVSIWCWQILYAKIHSQHH